MQADEKVQSHNEFKPFASGCRESSGKKLYGRSPKPSWVSDVACLLTDEGWLYLAGQKDLLTEEIAGYAMGERMTRDLVSQALFRDVAAKCAAAVRASMSRKGNCYDNTSIEGFWALKNESLRHCRFSNRQEAMREITEYMEIFYNRRRRQKRLAYLSPAAYEK